MSKKQKERQPFTYFSKHSALPLAADIERHRAHEEELRQKLANAVQRAANNPDDKLAARAVETYHHFLQQLLQSKAEVTSKIGKKK